MDILYRRGRATAGEVMDALPGSPSYSTVRTQLRVLEEKGHVRHEEHGLRYVYAPAVPRRAARKSALRHLVEHVLRRLGRERRRRAARRRRREALRRRARAHRRSGGQIARKDGNDDEQRSRSRSSSWSALMATTLLRSRSAACVIGCSRRRLPAPRPRRRSRLVAPVWYARVAAAWWSSSRVRADRPAAGRARLALEPATAAAAARPADGSPPRPRRVMRGARGSSGWPAPAPVCFVAGRRSGPPGVAGIARRAASPPDRGPIPRPTCSRASTACAGAPVLLQSDHPTLLVTWGFARPKVLLPADARQLARRSHSHRARPRARAHPARRLDRADRPPSSLRVGLLVQPARLDRVPAPAARKRTGVRRRGARGWASKDRRTPAELVDLARAFRSQRQMFLPAAGHCPSVKPREESQSHVERPPQSRSHHAFGVHRRRHPARRRRRRKRCRRSR